MVTPAVRGEKTVEEFSRELDSSFWRWIDLQDVEVVSYTVDEVEVSFRTEQDAAFGPDWQTCTDWHVIYRMVLDSGLWQIDRSRRLEDPAPCAAEQAAEQEEGDLSRGEQIDEDGTSTTRAASGAVDGLSLTLPHAARGGGL